MKKDDRIGGSETRVCPITKGECNDQCVLWVKLADYDGCALQIAETGLKKALSELAASADRLLGLKSRRK